jgi:hypothetical protein
MTLTVCILPVSGFMNHQLQFSPMTLERHWGMGVHNTAGILFVVFLLVHMGLNRRALWNYISTKRRNIVNRELLAAIALVAVSVVGFSLHAFHVH